MVIYVDSLKDMPKFTVAKCTNCSHGMWEEVGCDYCGHTKQREQEMIAEREAKVKAEREKELHRQRCLIEKKMSFQWMTDVAMHSPFVQNDKEANAIVGYYREGASKRLCKIRTGLNFKAITDVYKRIKEKQQEVRKGI